MSLAGVGTSDRPGRAFAVDQIGSAGERCALSPPLEPTGNSGDPLEPAGFRVTDRATPRPMDAHSSVRDWGSLKTPRLFVAPKAELCRMACA